MVVNSALSLMTSPIKCLGPTLTYIHWSCMHTSSYMATLSMSMAVTTGPEMENIVPLEDINNWLLIKRYESGLVFDTFVFVITYQVYTGGYHAPNILILTWVSKLI